MSDSSQLLRKCENGSLFRYLFVEKVREKSLRVVIVSDEGTLEACLHRNFLLSFSPESFIFFYIYIYFFLWVYGCVRGMCVCVCV